MDVVLVRWPDDGERRRALAAQGIPRLLLVDGGVEPPIPADCLEDWLRVPADGDEVRARVDAIRARAAAHERVVPELDEHGVLRFGGRWVSLPAVEQRLVEPLLERLGTVVGRDALVRSAWPDGIGGRNVLDVHVLRLRRRIADLGLALRTVRGRGYLLEVADTPVLARP